MTRRSDATVGGAVSHIGIVQGIYQAFGRGDVPAILAQLAPNVEWEYGINSTDVPWAAFSKQ